MGRRAPQLTKLELSFERHLQAECTTASTRRTYMQLAHRLLAFLGDGPLTSITDHRVTKFLELLDRPAASAVMHFVRFALGVPAPERGRHSLQVDIEHQYEQHLQEEYTENTVAQRMRYIRRFMKHVGDRPLERLSEMEVREIYRREFNSSRDAASAISLFVKFVVARLPAVVVQGRGFTAPAPVLQSQDEIALRHQWEADKRKEKKEAAEDFTVQLMGPFVDAYLYFQSRLNNPESPESIDEVTRLRDNFQDVMQANMAAFITLTAQGRNIHPIFSERVRVTR